MAQEAVKVEFVTSEYIQEDVQAAIDRIQAMGGRILGPVSLGRSAAMCAAMITYAVPVGD